MKVAFVLSATTTFGGATKAFLALAGVLQTRSVEVCVVVPDKEGIYPTLLQMGMSVLVLNYRPSTYTYLRQPSDWILFLPRMAARLIVNHMATRRLAAWLTRQQVDLVHTNVGIVRIGFDAAKRVGIPHVYHIREYADTLGHYYFPCKRAFREQLHRPASYSICITRAIQAYHGQAGKHTSRVIYDPACPARDKMPHCDNPSYFLFAGRVEPAKGLDFLLPAYAEYVRQSAHPLPLRVAGDLKPSAYLAGIRQTIRDNALEGLVTLLGPRKDIEDLMRQARAIIIPSPLEGFGFCMPEAMLNGCLAIGRNTGGTREQMVNGREWTGAEIALQFDTQEELTALLCAVGKAKPEDYDPYRQRAFRVVNAHYTPEASAAEVYEYYQQILSEQTPPHEKDS